MSQESKEAANEVKQQLKWAEHHIKQAGDAAKKVPDKELQRKIQEAVEKVVPAKEYIDKALEGDNKSK